MDISGLIGKTVRVAIDNGNEFYDGLVVGGYVGQVAACLILKIKGGALIGAEVEWCRLLEGE